MRPVVRLPETCYARAMRSILFIAVLGLAACGARGASGPAWPKTAASDTDGGESLAPREPAALAVAAAADDDEDVTVVAPPNLAASLRKGFPQSLTDAPVLLPLVGSTPRRELDAWFERNGVTPEIVAEAEDSALLKAFAADGMGAMFVPTAIATQVARRYDVSVVAELEDVQERFYAITAERRIVHPGVIAIRNAARVHLG